MSGRPTIVHPRYEVLDPIGRGGEGAVMRVVDREQPDRRLVAKVLHARGEREETLRAELAILRRALIPGLVRAHDLARSATGELFLVEDLVEGPEARAFIDGVGEAAPPGVPERVRRLVSVITGIAITLGAMHAVGVAHGDVKPAHVRVDVSSGRITLLDLGAAVSRFDDVGRGDGALTPAFAPPERARGGPPTPRGDLYSLGATAIALVGGDPRSVASTASSAPWLPPSLVAVLTSLTADAPANRPASAADVLLSLGRSSPTRPLQTKPDLAPPPPASFVGRVAELRELGAPRPRAITYIVGPAGIGKTHLARELFTRALLSGREARWISPNEGARCAALLTWLREPTDDAPFLFRADDRGVAPLLIVDDLHADGADLASALDLYRCREDRTCDLEIVAVAREAPRGATTVPLGPLSPDEAAALAATVGAAPSARSSARGVPGWIVASAGAVPLDRDTAEGVIASLSAAAKVVLGAVASAAGAAPVEVLDRALGEARFTVGMGELVDRALVSRRYADATLEVALVDPALAPGLAAALHDVTPRDELTVAMLESDAPSVASILALGMTETGARGAELFERAALRAKREGRTSAQIEALLALSRDPARRDPARVLELERLLRDSGASASHPEVLEYLTELAERSPDVALAALRRRAEAAARAGDRERADALVRQAIELARGGPREEALARATTGIVALFLSSYDEAQEALEDASARFAELGLDDREEVARVDHNLGVVALYRGDASRAARAFERALAEKRHLGDRSGARACLLNLGLSLARRGELDRADAALSEAERLARSLGQTQGLGWVLAARADVAVRAADPRRARDLVREAEAIADTLPGAVRADLGLLRAQIALLERDGRAARDAIDAIDADARRRDSLVDARALTLASEAALVTLPVDRIGAARLAVRALRIARRAGLRDAEESAARALGAARSRRRASYDRPVIAREEEDVLEPLWDALRTLASGDPSGPEIVAAALARDTSAERAFLCAVESGGTIAGAWAADLDGLPIAEARRRVPEALVALAATRDGPVVERDAKLGARVAIAGPATSDALRAVIVLEHRFVVHAFDGLTRATLARWAIAAGLALRPLRPPQPAPTSPLSDSPARDAPESATGARPDARSAIVKDIDLTTVIPTTGTRSVFAPISGKSPALRHALARLEIALRGDVPVLITGETGVGKELFARALHDHGPRADRPFVAVNCGAIPDTLFEAELFGHARGSFTGADRPRTGLLARAEGGTFFLDEIGELPLSRQATLLRVLQERRYRPVGSDVDAPFDVRVVAATNRDLAALAVAGGFRRDLLYRLNTVEIVIPPLRNRREDIPEIVDRFLARAAQRSGDRVSLSGAALDALTRHDWPGNVRELEHLVDRLCLAGVKEVGLEHLPRELRRRRSIPEAPQPVRGRRDDSERDEVHRALTATGGNISRAAAHLGITRHGLKKRMVRLGMREKRGEGAA